MHPNLVLLCGVEEDKFTRQTVFGKHYPELIFIIIGIIKITKMVSLTLFGLTLIFLDKIS
ncbi:hypothetical protein H1P_200035 [Hyella patelloides LEGE 07179]|uniref:Uncharacterized protein n=1 Tax=Hyella patelloides LEGE 07179 TaxID=945734 RepID=A0A563VQ02_9CYAN|nr:hypothetical protein H1P_200035 [Hyella patelloides LEGE 07179]